LLWVDFSLNKFKILVIILYINFFNKTNGQQCWAKNQWHQQLKSGGSNPWRHGHNTYACHASVFPIYISLMLMTMELGHIWHNLFNNLFTEISRCCTKHQTSVHLISPIASQNKLKAEHQHKLLFNIFSKKLLFNKPKLYQTGS
jgi:hypothetical protein